ncbi:ROK family transcriptional regulator [Paenibacillus xerothermodurans]|uniref:ROK family transcriptional regulator n=1 Tax=Paenibacillus xerothermodurans TaxID=1977292 RepID=A0A2W1P0W6_PAEXE|nr:ROK family transcriptional regulator [Paenibacillus xerothermodurans]PZE20728.1 ROK family transcriptional regulator [Paenibacillus xerothermodurans]
MTQTGDLNLMKQINKSIVLEHVKKHAPISRAKIAEITGLTKATVSTLVHELIDSRLVQEIGEGASSGGRKPMMLLFNHTAGYAVGVELGVGHISAVLTDLAGHIVEHTEAAHSNDSVDAVIHRLIGCIEEMRGRAPDGPYGIVGIGIGIPGIADERGHVLFAPNLGWEGVPLRARIEEHFRLPVVIDNEANAGALGEKEFGAGVNTSHLIYVSVSSGIGTGVIINGQLYRGVSGFSGEIGHTSIEFNGRACRCGNVGCWELYASEQAMLQQAQMLPGRPTDVAALARLAEQDNPEAAALLDQTGYYLGVGLINVINTFNPEQIIIGGSMVALKQWLLPPILQCIQQRSLPLTRAGLEIEFSALRGRSTLLGAASFAITRFFASPKVSV